MAEFNGKQGVWRTIGGRRVFIEDGDDLKTAMKKSGKFESTKRAMKDQLQNAKSHKERVRTDVGVSRDNLENARIKYGELSKEYLMAKAEYNADRDNFRYYEDKIAKIDRDYKDYYENVETPNDLGIDIKGKQLEKLRETGNTNKYKIDSNNYHTDPELRKKDIENDLKWFENMNKKHGGIPLSENDDYLSLKEQYESEFGKYTKERTTKEVNDEYNKLSKKMQQDDYYYRPEDDRKLKELRAEYDTLVAKGQEDVNLTAYKEDGKNKYADKYSEYRKEIDKYGGFVQTETSKQIAKEMRSLEKEYNLEGKDTIEIMQNYDKYKSTDTFEVGDLKRKALEEVEKRYGKEERNKVENALADIENQKVKQKQYEEKYDTIIHDDGYVESVPKNPYQNLKEHILSHYTEDYGYEGIPEEALKKQVEYMRYGGRTNTQIGEEIAAGGSYLIYNDDMKEFLDKAGISYKEGEEFDTYKKVIGRATSQIIDEYDEKISKEQSKRAKKIASEIKESQRQYTNAKISSMSMSQLRELANEYNIESNGLSKDALVAKLLKIFK